MIFTQGLIIAEDDAVISKRWLNKITEKIKQLNYPTGFHYTVKWYADQWLAFTKDLADVKKDLLAMQTKEEQALLLIYQSAPGIGEITALKLKDELGDMQQFSNEKKLFNYLGFTPVEYSSGEHVRQGHISRQGRAMLRHLFIEAAWIAIKKDSQLMEIYQRLANTRGGKRAIVGVARRLAGRLRSCVQQGVLYEIKSLQIEATDAKNELCVTS